jgi:hypothetical protein
LNDPDPQEREDFGVSKNCSVFLEEEKHFTCWCFTVQFPVASFAIVSCFVGYLVAQAPPPKLKPSATPETMNILMA